MSELTVELTADKKMPPHMLFLSVLGSDKVHVTVAPNVEATALSMLRPDVGMAVADAIQQITDEEDS
jgi:hypothetical protein